MAARRARRGWRGPRERGEFPTLGWAVGDWMESRLVIPDGPQRGRAYMLTNEMWRHLLWKYRLHPRATVDPRFPKVVDGRVYYGTQLRRSQKWGKDPFLAAKLLAHAFADVVFDGWNADGEPVGRPVDTPWVQIAATSEEQTDNTFRPLFRMLAEGPLADTPGLDIGETRIKLPNGDGWIEPVTAAARSRLGAPITAAGFTETHLMCEPDGGLAMVRAMKRNLAGMGGEWDEVTNAWDPSQQSAAQRTAEARAPGVFLDHQHPQLPRLPSAEFADDAIVRERLVLKYGDSARGRGGWVDLNRVLADIRDPATGEAEARRYFLDEVTVGERDAVDATRWHALARPGQLEPGTPIALGFDGSRARDATALKACRISDGRWFRIGLWLPKDYGGRPVAAVNQAVADAFAAYQVWYLLADPYRWETELDEWAGKFGVNPANKPRVIEFPTNVEQRMDKAIELWETAYRTGEGQFTHDGDPDCTQHALNAAISYGRRKPAREDGAQVSDRYKRVVKKKAGHLIDDFVAGILATFGRGMAIEHGALSITAPVPATAPAATADDPGGLYRPTQRLTI
ncbi:MAG TPA: hypothetical protein VGX25_04070 [Actinophytocola sp.]|uniref:hypothetical protein n=1 Tax=Actinophytocola sp. TaxID=1872138 RepID=UPI002DDCDCE0|nr:hypothetical protein [Actinophytocola sp.]HEV2778555.1 hypothetical protein [Actinophytocola sp.]